MKLFFEKKKHTLIYINLSKYLLTVKCTQKMYFYYEFIWNLEFIFL